MRRIVDSYFLILKAFIVLCLAMMVILVFLNVALRYGFGSGITISEEVSRWLFVYLAFVGATVAMREGQHLGVDLVVVRMRPATRRAFALICNVLMLWTCWLIFEGTWAQTVVNWASRAPATGLSMALLYIPGLVFSLTVGGILLSRTWQILSGREREPSEDNGPNRQARV